MRIFMSDVCAVCSHHVRNAVGQGTAVIENEHTHTHTHTHRHTYIHTRTHIQTHAHTFTN